MAGPACDLNRDSFLREDWNPQPKNRNLALSQSPMLHSDASFPKRTIRVWGWSQAHKSTLVSGMTMGEAWNCVHSPPVRYIHLYTWIRGIWGWSADCVHSPPVTRTLVLDREFRDGLRDIKKWRGRFIDKVSMFSHVSSQYVSVRGIDRVPTFSNRPHHVLHPGRSWTRRGAWAPTPVEGAAGSYDPHKGAGRHAARTEGRSSTPDGGLRLNGGLCCHRWRRLCRHRCGYAPVGIARSSAARPRAFTS